MENPFNNSPGSRTPNPEVRNEQYFKRVELADKRAEYAQKITDKEHLLDQLANHTPNNNHP